MPPESAPEPRLRPRAPSWRSQATSCHRRDRTTPAVPRNDGRRHLHEAARRWRTTTCAEQSASTRLRDHRRRSSQRPAAHAPNSSTRRRYRGWPTTLLLAYASRMRPRRSPAACRCSAISAAFSSPTDALDCNSVRKPAVQPGAIRLQLGLVGHPTDQRVTEPELSPRCERRPDRSAPRRAASAARCCRRVRTADPRRTAHR